MTTRRQRLKKLMFIQTKFVVFNTRQQEEVEETAVVTSGGAEHKTSLPHTTSNKQAESGKLIGSSPFGQVSLILIKNKN